VFYSASNAKLKVNGEEILASNASLSLSTSLQPNYLITQRNTNKYVASNGVGGIFLLITTSQEQIFLKLSLLDREKDEEKPP